jgi:hypothetical protein
VAVKVFETATGPFLPVLEKFMSLIVPKAFPFTHGLGHDRLKIPDAGTLSDY